MDLDIFLREYATWVAIALGISLFGIMFYRRSRSGAWQAKPRTALFCKVIFFIALLSSIYLLTLAAISPWVRRDPIRAISLIPQLYYSYSFIAPFAVGGVIVLCAFFILFLRGRRPPSLPYEVSQATNLEIYSGFEAMGEFLKAGIKVANEGGSVATDCSVFLESVPEALSLIEPSVPFVRLGNIRPGEFQSAIYKLKPTRCVDGSVTGVVNYYDPAGKRYSVVIPPIHIRNICPFLTRDGVVAADIMSLLEGDLLTSRSTSFEFKGPPKVALTTAENRVRHLQLVEKDERMVEGVFCGYTVYFGNAKYGGYYFATTILVSGTERNGRITLTVYSNEPSVVTGYVQEVMDDVRKHIESTQGITVLAGKCPDCGGELEPAEADEKGLIRCHHCQCLNIIPPWMRVKK